MKGFGMLLLYFFTWRNVIVGAVLAGMLVLALASSLAALSPSTSAAMALVAFILLLAVPYLSAPKALRAIISNRRLALVPGLPLRTGLAMLLLTLLTAAFLPLYSMLLDAPPGVAWLGVYAFIVASLYTLVSQLLLTSRYMWVHLNWLPPALVVALSLYGDVLLQLARDTMLVSVAAALAACGWLYALAVLARRRNFKLAHTGDVHSADQEMNSVFSSWVNRTPQRRPSPATSLILGYPANLGSRAINVFYLLVISPLMAVILMRIVGNNAGGSLPASHIFLGASLSTSFIVGAMAWAETGARARLLWLRAPGGRTQIWARLERDLWDYFLLLSAVCAAIVPVALLAGTDAALLLHYVLTLFTLTFYQRYLPLAARLNHWSSLAQALASLASIAAIGLALVVSLRAANFNFFFLLELCLLVLGAGFRALAKFGFCRVDWLALRPLPSKHAGAAA